MGRQQCRTVFHIGRKALLIFALCTAGVGPGLLAQDTDGDGEITILFPIAYEIAEVSEGAKGTRWTGMTWFDNPLEIVVRHPQSLTDACVPGCGIDPHTTVPIGLVHVAPDRGSLVHRGAPDPAYTGPLTSFEARVVETSRPTQPGGFEVPIVKESEFLRGPRTLLKIPRSEMFRSTLRVFDPRKDMRTSVLVEITTDTGVVLASTVLNPGNDPVNSRTDPEARFLPGYDAIYDIESVFAEVREYENPRAQEQTFNIRLTPLVEGTEFWAYVSVTHNETQHVFLVTP